MPRTPMNTALRIPPAEKAELQRLAAERGVTLSHALRRGARLYLEAMKEEKTPR